MEALLALLNPSRRKVAGVQFCNAAAQFCAAPIAPNPNAAKLIFMSKIER